MCIVGQRTPIHNGIIGAWSKMVHGQLGQYAVHAYGSRQPTANGVTAMGTTRHHRYQGSRPLYH
jgi:hypothetical protein